MLIKLFIGLEESYMCENGLTRNEILLSRVFCRCFLPDEPAPGVRYPNYDLRAFSVKYCINRAVSETAR